MASNLSMPASSNCGAVPNASDASGAEGIQRLEPLIEEGQIAFGAGGLDSHFIRWSCDLPLFGDSHFLLSVRRE